ncbi:MAG: hypothetical protein AB3N28_09995 [Kordiimonas sp.]
MTKQFDVSEWLTMQIGRRREEVLAEAKSMAKETRQAVVEANRGRVSMQQRAVISAASKIDARVGRLLSFATKLDKRPMGTSVADWAVFRDITASWVETGCVQPSVLELFES